MGRSVCRGVAALLLAATPAAAGSPEWHAATPGEVLAAGCTNCHAPAAGDAFPTLAGRTAAEIAGLLLEYKTGARGGTVMNRIAAGYTDDEIAAVAAALAAAP